MLGYFIYIWWNYLFRMGRVIEYIPGKRQGGLTLLNDLFTLLLILEKIIRLLLSCEVKTTN